MGKTKKTAVDDEEDEHPHEILRQNLKFSNKIITKNGIVKKKMLKQFTAYQCDVCNKKFEDKYNLGTHQKIHLNEAYSCDVCEYVGATKKYLARHKLCRHTAPRHQCAVCGQAFHHPCGLREHAMVHTGEKPLECDVCGKRFRVSYSLNSHMLIHRNERPFKCSFCEYACRDNSTLRRHEHRHMGILRTFSCKICRKKFDSKLKLKNHISEVHLEHLEAEVKRHECDHCGKTFKKRVHMITHIRVIHEEKPCACPVCGRHVKHERYLPRHLRTHFPERPHLCAFPGCGKAFKDKSVLNKHARIHQPHLHAACSQCDAKFARPHRLREHMRTHEPREKNVTCDYCRVTFYTKNYLIKHIKQKHTGEKQRYVCEHCGLVTHNKPSIVMHLKYGQCRDNELRCKICKTRYKKLEYLRSHYLRTHKMLYRPRKRQTKAERAKTQTDRQTDRKPSVEVKVEPVEEEDPYEEVQLALLDVDKEEHDVDEEGALENDLMSYSRHVLSEDLQTYLLTDCPQDRPDSSFDRFLLKHVFPEIKEEDPETKIEKTDKEQEAIVTKKIKDVIHKAKEDEAKKILEKKKKRQEKLLEKKLRKEAKIMRRKKRRERFELERVRQMYNERMRRAAAEAMKKEPAKKIKYFQQKTSEKLNSENESKNTSNSKEYVNLNDSVNDHNKSKELDSNEIVSKNVDSNDTNVNEITTNVDDTHKVKTLTVNLSKNTSIARGNDNIISEIIENEQSNDNYSVIMNTCGKDYSKGDKIINVEQSRTNDKEDTHDHICTGYEGEVTQVNQTLVNNELTNDNISCANDVRNNTIDEQNYTNDKYNETGDGDNINELNSAKDKNNSTIDNVTDDNEKELNNKDDDETDAGDSNNDKSDDSDYEPNSRDEAAPSKKMKFQTYQCYICFKLYTTKEELMSHCEAHFDICNSTTLSKCPVCGHVASKKIADHMRVEHDVHVNIAYSMISTRNDGQGSKYCYKTADTELEIIPSVKMLNHTAAVQIDKKKRELRDKTVAKTRLVKKGKEWIVETYAATLSYQEMPEFSAQELNTVPASSSGEYVARLAQLGKLARNKGVRILYPCHACDKICQSLAALKLHGRRHDPDKKPFAPRQNRRDNTRPQERHDTQVKDIKNRTAKPQPIKNKHKCDEKLKKFYETHIRGADIEFWQFLKIYNKMDRENVNEFTDLEKRTDFGIHNYGDSSHPEAESSKTVQQNDNTNIIAQNAKLSKPAPKSIKTDNLSRKKIVGKSPKSKSNLPSAQQGSSKRVIMISKRQHLEREKMKEKLRQKIQENK